MKSVPETPGEIAVALFLLLTWAAVIRLVWYLPQLWL